MDENNIGELRRGKKNSTYFAYPPIFIAERECGGDAVG